jgi:hypothetical protein
VASAIAFFASNEKEARAKLKRAFTLYEPFAYSLFLELCAIVAFSFAFGHRKSVPVAVARAPGTSASPTIPTSEKPVDPSPTTPGPGIPKTPPKPAKNRGKGGRKADARVIEFSEQYFRKFGKQPTGSDIKAAFPELAKSTCYDYAARARASMPKLRVVA